MVCGGRGRGGVLKVDAAPAKAEVRSCNSEVSANSTGRPSHTRQPPPPLMLGKCTPRLASHYSLAACALRAPCRLTSTHARIPTGEALGPTRDDAHQTFRLRRDGTAKELPLPPLLDPVILEKRLQWEAPKAKPKPAEHTPFQKKLQATPYGNGATLYVENSC
jgi:hypothetical protein